MIAIIYILGSIYFQFNAPNGPFDGPRYFVGFSIWILWMSAMALGLWLLYQRSFNKRYDDCLEKYQSKLVNNTDVNHENDYEE